MCSVTTDCMNNTYCGGGSATCPSVPAGGFKADLTACNGQTQVCISGMCTGSICQKYSLTQCYLQGNLTDPSVDKSTLCHLACTGSELFLKMDIR